jgi:hypothetical protein
MLHPSWPRHIQKHMLLKLCGIYHALQSQLLGGGMGLGLGPVAHGGMLHGGSGMSEPPCMVLWFHSCLSTLLPLYRYPCLLQSVTTHHHCVMACSNKTWDPVSEPSISVTCYPLSAGGAAGAGAASLEDVPAFKQLLAKEHRRIRGEWQLRPE